MQPRVEALTLWRPWPWTFTHLPAGLAKRLENRTWPPPAWVIGKWIALHAAAEYVSADGIKIVQLLQDTATGLALPAPDDHPLGIVAMVRVDGVVHAAPAGDQARWFFGPVAWVVGEVHPLKPVACRGFQKLWTVPQCAACDAGDPNSCTGCTSAQVLAQLPREIVQLLAQRPRFAPPAQRRLL